LTVLWHGIGGFLFGFVVLHPIAMFIFRWLDPRLAREMVHIHGEPGAMVSPLLHSFRPEMAPMGLVFALFSAIIASIDGYYRARVARQRDELARQSGLLTEKNARLVELERANRRHTQFMVHDFKGHLSTISGFVEHLLEKNESTWAPDDVDALTRIRRQTLRMAGAVTDLLALARLRGSPTLRRERTLVSALLATAAADLSLPVHGRQLEIGPGQHGCPDVSVDVRMIERVLVNLALNALRHNAPGTRVVLTACPVREGSQVAFTCADEGRGLSPAAQTSLFREFAPGDGTGEDSTGLGLAFCKAAVEANGGRIWCESVEGQGARFTFTVPTEQGSKKWRRAQSETSSWWMTNPTSSPT